MKEVEEDMHSLRHSLTNKLVIVSHLITILRNSQVEQEVMHSRGWSAMGGILVTGDLMIHHKWRWWKFFIHQDSL